MQLIAEEEAGRDGIDAAVGPLNASYASTTGMPRSAADPWIALFIACPWDRVTS